MRSFVIEDLHEFVEARLLLKEICRRWLSGFFFQSEMHAFVPAVLLGVAWLDALDANAQSQPPDRKLAQIE